ncbi:MAG: efflux RND transporter periplasmic adaptor subunit [Pseudomonadota bacterium]|nr:efflux RND transporter periplasmic adaptor subunit [Pseudomonadota bacterium]
MRKFLWIVPVLLAVTAWVATRWLWPSIEVVHPVRGPAVQAVYATGTVEATVMMPIAPRIAARLVELDVDEGSNVKKDQLLARLEDEDVQNALKQLQAQEEFARRAYERNAALLKNDAVSKADYDRSKADWEAAKAATAKAMAEANFMKLTAPADGLIIKRDGEIGQLIPANEPLFWLSCCAPLRISAEVDEEDIAQVKPAQLVLIRADAFPGQVFHGKVQAITPKGDPIARSYRVRIEFTEDTPLQIGMTAETNIITGEHKDALLLPSSAVTQEKVWLVKDGRLVRQPVVTGAKGAEQTEIKKGVAESDLVVLKPDEKLQAGRKVHTRLVEAPKP